MLAAFGDDDHSDSHVQRFVAHVDHLLRRPDHHILDLPFAVSPVVAGLIFVLGIVVLARTGNVSFGQGLFYAGGGYGVALIAITFGVTDAVAQVLIGDSLVITPPWLPAPQAEHVVTIEPARAFGTGAHATTQLCAELLIDYPARGSLLDVGCGSGVLAIIGALLGFDPVTAFDNDAASVEATDLNAERNGVAVAASRADLRVDQLPEADVTVANLLRPLLLELCKRRELHSKCLIASGLLEQEGDEVSAAFKALGYTEHRRLASDGWCALSLER